MDKSLKKQINDRIAFLERDIAESRREQQLYKGEDEFAYGQASGESVAMKSEVNFLKGLLLEFPERIEKNWCRECTKEIPLGPIEYCEHCPTERPGE